LAGSTYRIWNNSVSEVMTLTLSGNVLIGTTNDNGNKLRVNGDLWVDGVYRVPVSSYFICGSAGYRFNSSDDAFNNFIIYDNGNTYTRGNALIGTTTTPTPVSGVAFPLTVSSSAATRIRIDSTNASPNSGVGLYANGVQKFSFAMYGATSDFTIYNDALLAPALVVKGNNSNVLIGTTTSTGAKLEINGDIRTGTLDTGYVSGFWKLGRAVIGTQPSETHQIIVEINGQLYVIGAAQL
jgi:hypothetical protein